MSNHTKLWLHIALPFLLFVIIGSVGLVLFLEATAYRQSSREFAQLANANAEFIRTAHIPPTDRFAAYLTKTLGVQVSFRTDPPLPQPRTETVIVPLQAGMMLALTREAPSFITPLVRPPALAAFVVFWGLSLAIAWTIVIPHFKAQRRLLETERLAVLGKMAAALAHEIQNPVAAIRLHAQLLPATEQTQLITSETATIENLVNQWMFLTRPDPPQQSPTDLSRLLADTIRALTPKADHARVQIQYTALTSRHILADNRRLAQVFRNIIVNAIEAMPAGGTLTITLRDDAIEFADTGPGFSPNARNRWAEMFYTEKEGGMGIGLSVANEIIKAHGGRLCVANQPTGGALVRIKL